MKTLSQLACVLALILLASCETRSHRTRIERVWPADRVSKIKLRGINGKVKVQSDSGGKVILIAEVTASGTPARSALERGLIETQVHGNTLEIREKVVSKKLIEVIPFFGTGHVRIRYLLKVPESTDVAVTTLNGRIESEGVSGFLDLKTINGSIRVTTPRAQLEAKTVNGSIRAVFTEEFRGAQLRTVNGSIDLSVPAAASIDAQVDRVNGAFQTNIPISMDSAPGGRALSGSINGGDFPLEISTVNGSVKLRRREAQPQNPANPTTAELTLTR